MKIIYRPGWRESVNFELRRCYAEVMWQTFASSSASLAASSSSFSFSSFSASSVRLSASARLSTAIAKKTFNRISEKRRVKVITHLIDSHSHVYKVIYNSHIQQIRHNLSLSPTTDFPSPLFPPCNKVKVKDTVAADEENDKVDAHENSDGVDTAKWVDALVHDLVPILTCQNL